MQKMLRAEIERTEKLISLYKFSRSDSNLNNQNLTYSLSRLKYRILIFQHERLIHLLVTFLISLIVFGSFILLLIVPSLPVIVVGVLALSLFTPYIIHYFHLENGVQKLYQLYDELLSISEVLGE